MNRARTAERLGMSMEEQREGEPTPRDRASHEVRVCADEACSRIASLIKQPLTQDEMVARIDRVLSAWCRTREEYKQAYVFREGR